MEEKLRLLNDLVKEFDVDDFYNISFTTRELRLQGFMTSKKVNKYATIMDATPVLTDIGYIEITNGSTEIIFT